MATPMRRLANDSGLPNNLKSLSGTRGHQQLQAVVKRGRIGLSSETNGVKLLEVGAQDRAVHHAFTGAHPVVVALHGVDLTVVRDHSVGVRQRPLWEGVGRKPLVHQGQGGYASWIRQVLEVNAHQANGSRPAGPN